MREARAAIHSKLAMMAFCSQLSRIVSVYRELIVMQFLQCLNKIIAIKLEIRNDGILLNDVEASFVSFTINPRGMNRVAQERPGLPGRSHISNYWGVMTTCVRYP